MSQSNVTTTPQTVLVVIDLNDEPPCDLSVFVDLEVNTEILHTGKFSNIIDLADIAVADNVGGGG